VEPDITIYKLSGRLNIGSALQTAENKIRHFIADGIRKLVLDVTTLNYIDSSAIGLLISSNGQMEQAGGVIRIGGAQGAVAQTFRLIHMDRIMPLDDSVEAACASLRESNGGRPV
jgi:anti-anti-sigma factor